MKTMGCILYKTTLFNEILQEHGKMENAALQEAMTGNKNIAGTPSLLQGGAKKLEGVERSSLCYPDHLLSIESLTSEQLTQLIESSNSFIEISERELKKVPALRGKTIINVFLEASTRTRVSFEIAGKRLSADTINISGSGSSMSKGESLLDMARTLEAMKPDVVVVRHRAGGAPHFLAQELNKRYEKLAQRGQRVSTRTAIVNAGDGMHEHPTQALLDILTLYRKFDQDMKKISGKKVAIVGDIRHSRVARSNIWAHFLLGNEVRLVGPPTLVPQDYLGAFAEGGKISIHHDLESGLEDVDFIMVLRMQLERQEGFFVPNLEQYTRLYCVTEQRVRNFAKPETVVMHPGPVNRGIEISRDILEGERSLIEEQVKHGVAVRMAVLFHLATGRSSEGGES